MYAFIVDLTLPMEQTIARLKELLMAEKMGVVSEVDVQATLKTKLNHDMPAYKLLGICGAGHAKRALEADINLGALLPCGCAVFDLGSGHTRVALQDPRVVAEASGNPQVLATMEEARTSLERVAQQLAR